MPRSRLIAGAALLAGLASGPVGAAGQAAAAGAPEEVRLAGPAEGPWRRLFLDAMVVERTNCLARVFHAAEKHPKNPLIRYDKPWEPESYGPSVHGGTVMWDDGKLKMWYLCYHGGYRICYAESPDGIAWTKPDLGLIEFQGATANNICAGGVRNPDAPPEQGPSSYNLASVIKRLVGARPSESLRHVLLPRVAAAMSRGRLLPRRSSLDVRGWPHKRWLVPIGRCRPGLPRSIHESLSRYVQGKQPPWASTGRRRFRRRLKLEETDGRPRVRRPTTLGLLDARRSTDSASFRYQGTCIATAPALDAPFALVQVWQLRRRTDVRG